MRFAVDSNILIYAEGADDPEKCNRALFAIEQIGRHNILLPAQTLGETLRWMIRKAKFSRKDAVTRIGAWIESCEPLGVTTAAFREALALVDGHGFQVWDAVILAASAEGGAAFLLSEDMQHGFTWKDVTILNPFLLSEDEVVQLTSLQPTRH